MILPRFVPANIPLYGLSLPKTFFSFKPPFLALPLECEMLLSYTPKLVVN